MDKTTFLTTFKHSYKLLIIFSIVLSLYLSIIIYMADIEEMASFKTMLESMSSFADAFNINLLGMTSPLNFVASTFFGMIVMAFLMVFYIIQTLNLLIKPVRDNYIVYTLCTPMTRIKYAFNQGLYLLFSIAILFIIILTVGLIMLNRLGDFSANKYIQLVLITALLNMAIAMVSYLISVMFCNKRYGITLTVSFPIMLMVIGMIAGVLKDKYSWITNLSPFSWIDSLGIVTGTVDTTWMLITFPSIIILSLIASTLIFKRKNLYI